MSDKPLNQKGVTFIEVLVTMIVAAMITGAVAAGIFQLFTMSDRNSDWNAALTQVQNAGYWVSHDAVQAQEVDDDPLTGEFLILEWDDWDGTNAYKVVYTLEASGRLKRSYSINGGDPETIVTAQYIDPSTTPDWDEEEGVLTLVITAQVGNQTLTRTYKVEPRPTS